MRLRLPAISISELIADVRMLWRSNTVKALLSLLCTSTLAGIGMASDGATAAEAIIAGVDYALIIAAIYFRARAKQRLRFGSERRLRFSWWLK